MVVATAIAGSVTFNPETDSIKTPDGGSFKFEAPFGKELPAKGFDAGEDTFQVGVGRGHNAGPFGTPQFSFFCRCCF